MGEIVSRLVAITVGVALVALMSACTSYIRVPGAEEHYLVPVQGQVVNAFGQDVQYSGLQHCSKIVKHWYKPNEFPPEDCVWAGQKDRNGHTTPDLEQFHVATNESAAPKIIAAGLIGAGLGTSGLGIRPAQVSIRGIGNATANTTAFAGNTLEVTNIGKLPGHGHW